MSVAHAAPTTPFTGTVAVHSPIKHLGTGKVCPNGTDNHAWSAKDDTPRKLPVNIVTTPAAVLASSSASLPSPVSSSNSKSVPVDMLKVSAPLLVTTVLTTAGTTRAHTSDLKTGATNGASWVAGVGDSV